MRAVSTATSAARHSVVALAEGILIAAIVAALIMAFAPILKPADQLAGTQTVLAAKGDNGKGGGGGGKGGGGKGGGKPGGGGEGTSVLTIVMLVDANGNGAPNWGDTITFDIQTTATDKPYVELTCSQGGSVVYSAFAGFYPDYPWPGSQRMSLQSPAWTGGAADCRAVLNGGLTTLTFTAGA